MFKQIVVYIALSVVVSCGVGYATGYYVASNRAEKDIAAIRTILEKQESEKKAKETKAKSDFEKYRKETSEIYKRWESTPAKSY